MIACFDRSLAPLRSSLLLSGWKRAVELAIDEKISQDSAWAPRYAIGPSLNARGCLLVNEDISTDDERIPFPIVWPTETMSQGAVKTSLKNN